MTTLNDLRKDAGIDLKVSDAEAMIASAKETMAAAKLQMVAAGKVAFADISKALFEQFPGLLAFEWTQYTPFFNDGDECNFGVNSEGNIFIQLSDGTTHPESLEEFNSGYDEYSYYDWRDEYVSGKEPLPDYYSNLKNDLWVFEASKLTSKLVNDIDPDTLRTLFGDHVRITVLRDGTVDVEDYEHE